MSPHPPASPTLAPPPLPPHLTIASPFLPSSFSPHFLPLQFVMDKTIPSPAAELLIPLSLPPVLPAPYLFSWFLTATVSESPSGLLFSRLSIFNSSDFLVTALCPLFLSLAVYLSVILCHNLKLAASISQTYSIIRFLEIQIDKYMPTYYFCVRQFLPTFISMHPNLRTTFDGTCSIS